MYIRRIASLHSIHKACAFRRGVVGPHLYHSRQRWRRHGLACESDAGDGNVRRVYIRGTPLRSKGHADTRKTIQWSSKHRPQDCVSGIMRIEKKILSRKGGVSSILTVTLHCLHREIERGIQRGIQEEREKVADQL